MTWAQPACAYLPDGRLHLQHGPIDLIVEVMASENAREDAFASANERFQSVLLELVEELPALRSQTSNDSNLKGRIAKRMLRATKPLAGRHFITPMAAVAGAVADEMLIAMIRTTEIKRAYVNNGGDIAFYLESGQSFTTGLVAKPERPQLDGQFTVRAKDPVRGIATSGRHGRSLSLGIADSVTVLAANAAAADAAATIIANHVDLPEHPAIERQTAQELDPDSDLGDQKVTTGLGSLNRQEIDRALSNGLVEARRLQDAGLIHAAVLTLQDQIEVCDGAAPLILKSSNTERAAYA